MFRLGRCDPRLAVGLVGGGRVNRERLVPTFINVVQSQNGFLPRERQPSSIPKGHHRLCSTIMATMRSSAQPNEASSSHRRHNCTTTQNKDSGSNSTTSTTLWKKTLQDSLPHVEFSTNPYELERHGRGESFHPTRRPDLIAVPTNVDDIITIMKFCMQHKIPLIPFGVGTSVEGHVCCLEGGISLDMKLFQSMQLPNLVCNDEKEDSFDPIATVGAGVTRRTLNNALRHTGLQFVVDPGADATLGGMVATGASGTTAVRYGTMRENILQLECVLPDVEGWYSGHHGNTSLEEFGRI
jgi:hypothetical protein